MAEMARGGRVKSKIACFIAVILLLVIIGAVIFAFAMVEGRRVLAGSEIIFSGIGLSDTSFEATGWIISSGVSFRKYAYVVQGSVLNITVYGGLACRKYPSGNFVIDIKHDLREVNIVRLKSGGSETVIFER